MCRQKGYSGFVLWRGNCYFRSSTKGWDDLRRSRVRSAEHTLYINVPLVVNQSEFELIPMSESCEGQDADSLLNFESLYHCQVKCIEGNYGGFVTWNGHAYFRKMHPQALVKAAVPKNTTDLWVWHCHRPEDQSKSRRKLRRHRTSPPPITADDTTVTT
mmetsp:Transcript_19752/g.31354  ORF Transcript_19752/g.31354 Transcript_19752/m.31354 type:complete len:159 (+) Transcript_19752:614-1090(+)